MADRQGVDPSGQRRAEQTEVDRLCDHQIQEVVDDRRRAIGPVVREADRLVLARLDHERRAWREHEVVQEVEVIDAPADDPPEPRREEDFVLNVAPEFLAVVGVRGNGELEPIESQIAAVADDVLGGKGLNVRRFEVVGARVEVEHDRLALGVAGQQVVGVAIQDVREEARVKALFRVVRLGIPHHGAARDVERPDPGVHDAFRTADPAGDRQLAPIRVVVVDAAVDLRLRGAFVLERRIRSACAGGAHRGPIARHGAGRSCHRILRVASCRNLVRPFVVDGLRVGAAHVPERSGIRLIPAIEPAKPDDCGRPLHLSRRFRDDVDHAVQGIRAPDGRCRSTDDLDLFHLVEVHGQEVPHHEAEEILIQAAAVEERQLAGCQRAGGAAARDVDVAGGDLRHVQPGHRPQQLREVL